MPQGPFQSLSVGPTSSALNVTAAKVIKATPGHIGKLLVIAPGTTGGVLTLNDCAAVADAATANEIISIAFGGLTAGQVIDLGNWPCKVGIVVSAVPSAGSPNYSISFT